MYFSRLSHVSAIVLALSPAYNIANVLDNYQKSRLSECSGLQLERTVHGAKMGQIPSTTKIKMHCARKYFLLEKIQKGHGKPWCTAADTKKYV